MIARGAFTADAETRESAILAIEERREALIVELETLDATLRNFGITPSPWWAVHDRILRALGRLPKGQYATALQIYEEVGGSLPTLRTALSVLKREGRLTSRRGSRGEPLGYRVAS